MMSVRSSPPIDPRPGEPLRRLDAFDYQVDISPAVRALAAAADRHSTTTHANPTLP